MRKTTVRGLLRAGLVGVCMMASAAASRADEIDAPKPKVETKEDARKAPGPFHRKLFWAETGVLATSAAWDWTTTAQCQQRGCQESASRWAIGSFPSNRRIAGYGAAWFAGDVAALYFTEKSRHRWLRWLGRTYIGYETENHFALALHNRGLCRTAGSCGGKL